MVGRRISEKHFQRIGLKKLQGMLGLEEAGNLLYLIIQYLKKGLSQKDVSAAMYDKFQERDKLECYAIKYNKYFATREDAEEAMLKAFPTENWLDMNITKTLINNDQMIEGSVS